MSDSNSEQRRKKIMAWAGTTGMLGFQGAMVRKMVPGMEGFQTGMLNFLKSSTRTAFQTAPWQVKVATGVMLGFGLLAKRPVQGFKSLVEETRHQVNQRWKD